MFYVTLTFRTEIVTVVQLYVSTKLEVSTGFLFPENRRHATDGLTDGEQHLMRLPRAGRTTSHLVNLPDKMK